MPTKIGRTQHVTATECAEMLTVKLATFTAYVNRGIAPAPAATIAGRRFWKLTEMVKFRDNRPGPGARTDLKKAGKR